MTTIVLIAFLFGILAAFVAMFEHAAHLVNVVTHIDIRGCFLILMLCALLLGCIIGTQLAN